MSARDEQAERFPCFGSNCAALVLGSGAAGSAADAVSHARRRLLCWHERFSRFLPDSELTLLNADPRSEVPASPLMARFAQAVHDAGALTDGLVDATLLAQIEQAGYGESLSPGRGEDPPPGADDDPSPRAAATRHASTATTLRGAATASAQRNWARVYGDTDAGVVRRPAGVMLDSGGLAKGLFADTLAAELAGHAGFVVDCAGDLAIGGESGISRAVRVASPFDGGVLHTFHLRRGGVATSGITRRRWRDRHGQPAHHLLDPASGEPAFTGIVQVTALAPSTLMAEIRAKAALLSGPRRAASWLPEGGVVVLEDGTHHVLEPPATVTLDALSSFIASAGARSARGTLSATAIAPATSPAATQNAR